MTTVSRIFSFKLSRFVEPLRHCSQYKSKLYKTAAELDSSDHLDDLIKKFAHRLIYNTIVENKIVRHEYLQRKNKYTVKEESVEPIPISLQFLNDEITVKKEKIKDVVKNKEENLVNFPYDSAYTVESHSEPPPQRNKPVSIDIAAESKEEVQKRYEMQKELKTWMVAYDNYDDSILENEGTVELDGWEVNYGTPDPKTKISNIPCGGCGALLHCKDTAIPGYIPSEILKNCVVEGGSNLQTISCQRCHFLKHYNMALQVQVTPEDYPKVLTTISKKQGLVVLMVDLLDFPCSIWPGIGDIFGSGIPIVIVGNKVDLLPQDSRDFLKHIKKTLLENVRVQGFATFNIKEVALISAKTGYGIEDLVTKLNSLWKYQGNVYIVGCTNVGKSTLFNAFLQSDFCKNQAVDLIQRATTSVWPGTTLNLLKFPIKRPAGYRQYLRHKRLEIQQKMDEEERAYRKERLKSTKDLKYASLIGHIGITKNPFTKPEHVSSDFFIAQGPGSIQGGAKMGINEKSEEYVASRWCYDTPGVVQPDQIIHLLTTDELLLTLPKELIVPRTYCIKEGSSLFIAGLARLDYLEGPESVRLTVFASNELPVTVCALEDADQLYVEMLGTDLMKVPTGGVERISKWPNLTAGKEFSIVGIDWRQSATDVILSNAGWVAITGKMGHKYNFRPWTPEKRGIHLRDCLLPHAVARTGKRIKNSVAYHKYKFFLQ